MITLMTSDHCQQHPVRLNSKNLFLTSLELSWCKRVRIRWKKKRSSDETLLLLCSRPVVGCREGGYQGWLWKQHFQTAVTQLTNFFSSFPYSIHPCYSPSSHPPPPPPPSRFSSSSSFSSIPRCLLLLLSLLHHLIFLSSFSPSPVDLLPLYVPVTSLFTSINLLWFSFSFILTASSLTSFFLTSKPLNLSFTIIIII